MISLEIDMLGTVEATRQAYADLDAAVGRINRWLKEGDEHESLTSIYQSAFPNVGFRDDLRLALSHLRPKEVPENAIAEEAIATVNALLSGLGPGGYVLPAGAIATSRARAFLAKHDPEYVAPVKVSKPSHDDDDFLFGIDWAP